MNGPAEEYLTDTQLEAMHREARKRLEGIPDGARLSYHANCWASNPDNVELRVGRPHLSTDGREYLLGFLHMLEIPINSLGGGA